MTIIGIVLTCFLGVSLLYSISNKFDILEAIGFSFPLGIGLQTLLMLLLNFLGFKFNINLIFILSSSIITLLGIIFFIKQRFSKAPLKERIKKRFRLPKIGSYNLVWLSCLALIAYIIYAISAKSLFWPTFASDSLSSFDLFAKGLAREGKIINTMILEKRVGNGVVYPPLYSLALAYSYMLGFKLSKIIPVLFFIFFSISFYSLIKKLINPTSAIFFTLLAIVSPELIAQSAINITNVPQAVYAALGIISIIAWYKLKENKYLYLSAILLSFNAFIRSEGIVNIFAVAPFLIAITLKTKQYRKTLLYFFISIAPFVLWQFFLKTNSAAFSQYPFTEMTTSANLDYNKINEILEIGVGNVMNSQYFGITFYLFIIMIFLNGYNIIKKKDSLWLLSIICLSFFGYLALLNQIKFRTPEELTAVLNYSAKRFAFGTIFLMWFYIAFNSLSKTIFEKIERFLNFNSKK